MNIIRQTSNKAWAFLWTEMEPKAKPLLLFVADRILNPISYTEIDTEGFSNNKVRPVSERVEQDNLIMSHVINLAALGFGFFGANLVAGFGGFASKLFTSVGTGSVSVAVITFPSMLAFTAISFSAKILGEKLGRLTYHINKKVADIATVALIIFFILAISFLAVYAVGTFVEPLVTFIYSSSPALQSHMQSFYGYAYKKTSFLFATQTIAFIAFNIFAGALLKFIAYKIYSSVQNAYDKFFTALKAGEKDSRADNDIVLRKSFKNLPQTVFEEIPLPLEMLSEIRKFLSSTDTLKLRASCKIFFSLTTNSDIIKIKIRENFSFGFAENYKNESVDERKLTGIKIKKYENFLLNLLYTYPISSRQNDQNENISLDVYIPSNNRRWFWFKSSNNTYVFDRALRTYFNVYN